MLQREKFERPLPRDPLLHTTANMARANGSWKWPVEPSGSYLDGLLPCYLATTGISLYAPIGDRYNPPIPLKEENKNANVAESFDSR